MRAADCDPFGRKIEDFSPEVLLMIHGIHVLNQAQELIGVAHLVVIPADNLDEGIRQRDAGLGIKDRGAGIPQEVRGNHGLLGIASEAAFMAWQISS